MYFFLCACDGGGGTRSHALVFAQFSDIVFSKQFKEYNIIYVYLEKKYKKNSMGIKNINMLLKAKNQTGILPKHISDYAGKKIAIDFSNYMYKFVYHIKKGNLHKYHYIENMFGLITNFRKYNIIPIFVYDGAPPQEKHKEIQRRIDQKENVNNKINNLISEITNTLTISDTESKPENGNKVPQPLDINIIKQICDDLTSNFITDQTDSLTLHYLNQDKTLNDKLLEVEKLNNQCLYVTHKHKKYCAALFRYLGVPYIYSEREADDMMGYLYKNGHVDACLSEDTDMLAHGIGVVLRNYNMFNGTVTEYNLNNICKDLSIDFSQFLDICILCGTDYYKINGIGPKRAHSIIQKYGSVMASMDYIKKRFIKGNDFNTFDYKNIRNMFEGYNNSQSYANNVKERNNLKWNTPRYEKLITLLKETCDINLTTDDIKQKMNL